MKTIRRFFNNAEAEFARTLLVSVGIEAMLAEENANTLGPGYAPGGVRLQVPDESVARALEILAGGHEEFTPLPDDFVPPEETPDVCDVVPSQGLGNQFLAVLAVIGVVYLLYRLLAPLNWTHTTAELVQMGNAAADKRDYAMAIKCFDAALILNQRSHVIYYDRGLVFFEEKDYQKAIADFTEAINRYPQHTQSYTIRASAYERMERHGKALDDLNTAIRLDPKNYRTYCKRGYVYSRMDNAEMAIEDYHRAIELAPEQSLGYNNLAWLYATWPRTESRDGTKALELAEKACELSEWKKFYCIGTLAAAEAEAGKFDDAVKHQQQAMAMAKGDRLADEKRLDQMADALADYQQKKPYRDLKK